MTQQALIIAAIVAVVVVVLLLSQRKKDVQDFDFPAAPQRRYWFGMYGCFAESQLAATKGWVNLYWDHFRRGVPATIEAIKFMACDTLLDLEPFLYVGPTENKTPSPDAEANLRGMFQQLQAAGVLQYVKLLSPKDEPNLYGPIPLDTLPAVAALIRKVAGEFPELNGVRLACLFTSIRDWAHLDQFEFVGCDEYDAKSRALLPDGAIGRMKSQLKPGQQLFIVPGASYGQHVTEFIDYANGDPQVAGVITFLHTKPEGEGFKDSDLVSQPALLAEYQAAGRAVIAAHE